MKRPLLVPILSFLTGIFLAGFFTLPTAITIIVLVLTFTLLIAAIKNARFFFPVLCLFFFLLGAFRYTSDIIPAPGDISSFLSKDQQEAVIYGTVTSDPEQGGPFYARYRKFSFDVDKLLTGDTEQETTGSVLVTLFSEKDFPEIGDRLALGGKLSVPPGKTNPGGFDYGLYLKRNGIRAVMYSGERDHYFKTGVSRTPVILLQRFLFSAREKASRVISKFLSGTPKAVIGSVILGRRGDIADQTEDIFVKTGTMHILAVSGLHVGILAFILLGLFRLLLIPRNLSYVLTILGICAFAVFAGARPSSLRAAIMGSFVLFGLMLGRKADILSALALSALLITFFQPGQLFQAGFILSYLAVLSIVLITPLTDALFNIPPFNPRENIKARIKRYALKSLSLSLAVWVGMIPVIAAYFKIITPSVFINNLVAVPVLSVLIVLGFCLVLLGSFAFLIPLAVMLSRFLNVLIGLFINIMRMFSQVPFSFVRVPSPNFFLSMVYYAALAGVIFLFTRKKASSKTIVLFLIFAANLFVWNEVFLRPPDAFQTTFFDVRKADAAVLEFTDGSVMMIDGGSGGNWTGRDAGRNVIAPYLWQRGIRKIDCVLLTHDHEDHIGGLLYILDNFKVGTVIDGGGRVGKGFEKKLYERFLGIIKKKKIERLEARRGDIIEGLPEAKFYCFNPPGDFSYGDPNNDSIVVKAITNSDNSIIFCADAASRAMKDMLRFGPKLRSNLMKVPHHGGGLGDMVIAREFLEETGPNTAVISSTSRYVKEDLLKTFQEMGTKVYVTSGSGAIIAKEKNKGFIVTSEVE
ncbi:MAG: DNA internalization-related competence protein ComEC/Rec2 [Candidatus Omnitrophota bacterium]